MPFHLWEKKPQPTNQTEGILLKKIYFFEQKTHFWNQISFLLTFPTHQFICQRKIILQYILIPAKAAKSNHH